MRVPPSIPLAVGVFLVYVALVISTIRLQGADITVAFTTVETPLPLALAQVVLALVSGTSLYLTRRATGSIVPAMVLHGLWDRTTFTQSKDHFGGYGSYILLATSLSIFIAFLLTRKLAFAGTQPATAQHQVA